VSASTAIYAAKACPSIYQVTAENLEELVDHLDTFTLDVDEHNTKFRLFCE
jgi:hypothetical protein